MASTTDPLELRAQLFTVARALIRLTGDGLDMYHLIHAAVQEFKPSILVIPPRFSGQIPTPIYKPTTDEINPLVQPLLPPFTEELPSRTPQPTTDKKKASLNVVSTPLPKTKASPMPVHCVTPKGNVTPENNLSPVDDFLDLLDKHFPLDSFPPKSSLKQASSSDPLKKESLKTPAEELKPIQVGKDIPVKAGTKEVKQTKGKEQKDKRKHEAGDDSKPFQSKRQKRTR